MNDENYKVDFFQYLCKTYEKHKMNKNNYEIVKKMIQNQYKKDANKEKFDGLLSTLDKFYEGSIDQNIDGSQSTELHIQLNQEQILGDNKRKYDMSYMINPDLIKTHNGRKVFLYHESDQQKGKKENEENRIYIDSLGRRIQIQKVGTLYFEQWNGLGDYVDQYKIKSSSISRNVEYKIFSNINIYRMSSKGYKDAVLDELLSENNITLANANGYIGEIESNTDKDNNSSSQENRTNNEYSYKINDDYKLIYDPAKVTIAAIYKQRQKDNVTRDKSCNLERE